MRIERAMNQTALYRVSLCDQSKSLTLVCPSSCAGAGTAADCDHVTAMIKAQVALLELNSGRDMRVGAVTRILKQYLYRYQGN